MMLLHANLLASRAFPQGWRIISKCALKSCGCTQALLELTQKISCKINLIPFNPHPGSPFQPSHTQDVLDFRCISCPHQLLIVLYSKSLPNASMKSVCSKIVGWSTSVWTQSAPSETCSDHADFLTCTLYLI